MKILKPFLCLASIVFFSSLNLSAQEKVTQVSHSSNNNGGKASSVNRYQHFSLFGQYVQSSGEISTAGFSSTYGFLNREEAESQVPIANAGSDIEVVAMDTFLMLDGSGSFAPENRSLSYQWRVIGDAQIDNPNIPKPTVVIDGVLAVREVQVVLVVSDGETSSAPDTLTITVTNPDWVPVAYMNSATFYGLVKVAENVDATEEDYVGAYIDGENRGVARVTLIDGEPFVIMNIQTEAPAEVFFRIYDADKNQVCDVEVRVSVAPNISVGSPNSPIPLTGNCAPCPISDATFNLMSTIVGCDLANLEVVFPNGRPDGLELTWSTGDTSVIVEDVPPGDYSLTVSSSVCEITKSIAIPEFPSLNATVELIQTAGCEADNGIAEVSVEGGRQPYQFLWSNGERTARAVNLVAGLNSVTVIDLTGCTLTLEVDASPTDFPEITNVEVTDYDCPDGTGEQLGTISLQVSGGLTPYNFNWSNGANTQNLSNLEAGEYRLTVIDAKGCVAITEVIVVESFCDRTPVANAGPDLEIVVSNNTSIVLDGSGSFSPIGKNLNYNWTLIGSGEAALDDATLESPALLIGEIIAIRPIQAVLVVGDGEETSLPDTVNIKLVNPDWVPEVYTNSASFFGLAMFNENENATEEDYVGAFIDGENRGVARVRMIGDQPFVLMNIQMEEASEVEFRIYDYDQDLICDVLSAFQASPGRDLGSPSEPVILMGSCVPCSAFSDDFTLNGVSDYCGASFVEVILGDNVPEGVRLIWSTGDTLPRLENISAGEYAVTLSTPSCEFTQSITIEETPSLTVSLEVLKETDCGSSNGIGELRINGGIGPFNILWSNGASGSSNDSLQAGFNYVTVTDAQGCEVQAGAFAGPTDFPFVSEVQTVDYACPNGQNQPELGAISISVSGGAAPFSYAWSNGATTEDISGLEPGSYDLTVTDARGCVGLLDSITVRNVCLTSLDDLPEAQLLDHTVFPNPFNNQINFEFEFDGLTEGTIDLINLQGQLIRRQRFNAIKVENSWPADGLDAALYYLLVRTGKVSWRFPIIKK
jgi:hypothetical protein